jgi:hypothetical protein
MLTWTLLFTNARYTVAHPAHEKFNYDIVELHEFFVSWFRGEVEKSDEYFQQRFTARFADNFEYILPGGELLQLNALTDMLQGAYASSPEFKMNIRDVHSKNAADTDLAMVNYLELQTGALNSSANNARISSALMKLDDATPNGVLWLNLHETWLDETTLDRQWFDF